MGDQHTVWRHGGRRTDHWRQVYTGSPTEAEVRFYSERSKMRQGAVAVLPAGVDPYNVAVRAEAVKTSSGDRLFAPAPRLRTRW